MQREPTESAVPTEFDPGLFWDTHKVKIIALVAAIIFGIVLTATFKVAESRKILASRAMLLSASTASEYQALIDQFPGTIAAGNAHLPLAASQREDGKFDEAIATLQSFIDNYPDHPLVGGAKLAIGATQEAAGRPDEAMATFKQAVTEYPGSYGASASMLAEATLLRNEGKSEEARRIYEDLASQFPESYMAQMAQAELRLLK